ncbi:uncharacterized protein STEHIDRAFT_50834 [Stereum hirsutum FP-91666 SS1]|uniref:uncharacterized protein n=1 Tax=Stereum hirsutum (strain FP-91666) TaxID=721885 RepID=UPI000440B0EF|nr:uncharacterized protein STEHIDRAFT_50834 [Stereum hirsutum FP-91666 SS1]EIM90126.1 hypothetical protein STEHIDRAFT_50834 [Stereum hirsutum FP-91666 SS1]
MIFLPAVASGDPFNTSVLLWTRAVPFNNETGTGPSPESVPVCVSYSIFNDSSLEGTPVDSAQGFTSFDVDFTVKMEATGLEPDTKYWYQFADCTNSSNVSPVGATRTIASPDTPAEQVNGGNNFTLAVFSCSQYQAGWFNAYNFASHNTTADVFVHLGDYVSDYSRNGVKHEPIGRKVEGRELATVHDYRQRIGQYRTDVGLIAAHQNAPWITVWDDHEVADQAWKAGTADSNDSSVGCSFSESEACFTDRKLAAVRAYHEWLPIRQVDADDKLRIWRNFQIGQLLDLTMLDTRQYDRDVTDVSLKYVDVNTIAAFANRSLMGFEQENWFFDSLTESQARGAVWRVVGQQIVFTQLNESGVCTFIPADAWDGYRANRQRVLDHLFSNGINNTVILSGDSHANWVSDLAHPNDTSYDPITGAGAAGVEFAGTAVTSGSSFGANISPAAADVISTGLVAAKGNEELQWSEGSYRGFFTLTINPDTLTATYYAMNNTNSSNLDGFASAQFVVENNANKLSRPVAGGVVNAGVLKSSVVNATNSSSSSA